MRGRDTGSDSYLNMTRFILFLWVLLYSSSEDSTTDVSSSSDDTSSYSLTSYTNKHETIASSYLDYADKYSKVET